jgi:hypothetical protein
MGISANLKKACEKGDVVQLIQKLFDRERKPDEWKRMPREA